MEAREVGEEMVANKIWIRGGTRRQRIPSSRSRLGTHVNHPP